MSMSAMSHPDTRVRPSPWWYAAVVVLWIASLVVFIIAIMPIITIFNTGVDQVINNRPVVVRSDGFTVYSSIRPSSATCTLQGQSGSPIQMDAFDLESSGTFTFTFDNGTEVKPLATTPDNLAAGTYQLSCEVPRRAILATGDRLDFGEFGARLVLGIIGSIVAGIVGLIILIVMLVKRHNSKQRIRQAQAAAAYGYGGYPGYAQGGYPQGGYPQGGYPQGGYAQPEQTPPAGGSPYGTPSAPPSPPPPAPPSSDPPGDPGQPPPEDRP
jgi:hypothetical protein